MHGPKRSSTDPGVFHPSKVATSCWSNFMRMGHFASTLDSAIVYCKYVIQESGWLDDDVTDTPDYVDHDDVTIKMSDMHLASFMVQYTRHVRNPLPQSSPSRIVAGCCCSADSCPITIVPPSPSYPTRSPVHGMCVCLLHA